MAETFFEIDPDVRFFFPPDAVSVDPFTLEPPVGADGSWVALPVLRFPEADTYQGTATKAVMTFSIPLPDQLGVLERWWADRFRNGIIEEAQRQGVTPLVVAAWRDTTSIFSTNYSLTIIAAGASPVAIPVLIALVVGGLKFTLILSIVIGIVISVKSIEHIFVRGLLPLLRGTEGTPDIPAQLVPAGTPAPPGTLDAFGHPVKPGDPAPDGAYIPPKPGTPGKPGALEALTDLAPLILIGFLAMAFTGKRG